MSRVLMHDKNINQN